MISSPCRLSASTTRSAVGMRTTFAHRARWSSHGFIKQKGIPRGYPFGWVLPLRVNIPHLAAFEQARRALRWECEPHSRTARGGQATASPNKKGYRVGIPFCLVETGGLEPLTPCMSSKYSNQLSYASILRIELYTI